MDPVDHDGDVRGLDVLLELIGDLIRQLEHRLAQTDEDQDGELTPGQIACHLLNENLTRAVDRAMRDVTLEELMKDITKASDQQQQMYYI